MTTTSDVRPETRGRAPAMGLAVVVGIAMACQARINGELAGEIDDFVVAALISFAGGMVLLGLSAAAVPGVRCGVRLIGATVREGGLRPWQLLGGTCGAFLVVCQGLSVGTIGVAVFTVAVVAGQAFSSLLVDRAGLGPGAAEPLSVTRIAGAVLALVAVVLAVSDRLGAPAALGLALLPALAGVAIAWQQAVNGRVGAAAGGGRGGLVGTALPAALVNFGVGTVALVLVAVVEVAARGLPEALPLNPLLYLGGPLGVLFIGVAAAVVPLTGVLLLGLGTVAGQLIGAVLLDLFVPAAGEQLSLTTLVGAALTLVAVAVAALPTRRRARF